MSRRTAASNKAILAAWKNEQALIKEGKGTRDWTLEQQKDILERGKAYDKNGKAFEGQHMRSAEANPEYQGDPKNIQFLTREEHFDAHGGSWRNPTNWYYDPVTMERHDFGDGPIVPCKVISLSKQIIEIENLTNMSLYQQENDIQYARVVDVDVTTVEESPPLLHNLTSLQIEANRRFGMTAAETLACVQHLYEEGDVTYPRTSSRYISSDMENTVKSLISETEDNS